MGSVRLVSAMALAASALLGALPMDATTVLETTSKWNGTGLVDGIFGESISATAGQVFVVPPEDDVLTSFTFFVDDLLDPGPVDFQAFVADWTGTRATSPILFQSAPAKTTNNDGQGGFEEFTFEIPGGLRLTSGNDYVAFLSTSNLFDGVRGRAFLGFTNPFGDSYPDGVVVRQTNGEDFDLLTQADWAESFPELGDLAFEMVFVPEPAPVALLLTGLFATTLRSRQGG